MMAFWILTCSSFGTVFSDLKGGFELRPPIAAFVVVPCDNHGRYAGSRWHIGIIDIGLVISELVVAPD